MNEFVLAQTNPVAMLLRSPEPSVRCRVLVYVLSANPESDEAKKLREELRLSRRVQALLSGRGPDGRIPFHPYAKWYGAHWVLASLADCSYPAGDQSLAPLREQVLDWLLSPGFTKQLKPVRGLVRMHASMEGNAIYTLLSLGLADGRVDDLVNRLLACQWPDGGWNCQKEAGGATSSFMETLIPLRALVLYGNVTGNERSQLAAKRAAEVFLTRHLFQRRRDGRVIRDDFTCLHYPCYWHYDILFGLKVMAEAGFIGDERCTAALDLLESKRLPDSGFPAEVRYYHLSDRNKSARSPVDWGVTSKRRMNPFVTADALHVLKEAGRLRGLLDLLHRERDCLVS
jgi:hypothetical protein